MFQSIRFICCVVIRVGPCVRFVETAFPLSSPRSDGDRPFSQTDPSAPPSFDRLSCGSRFSKSSAADVSEKHHEAAVKKKHPAHFYLPKLQNPLTRTSSAEGSEILIKGFFFKSSFLSQNIFQFGVCLQRQIHTPALLLA